MQVAISSEDKRCIAFQTEKNEEPFFCPKCSEDLILKKGKIREHHFAHHPPCYCDYGKGESQIHYKCKRELFEILSANKHCSFCEMEKPLGGVRPDVFAVIGSQKVAIEVQKSDISTQTICHRMAIYNRLGIYVLWLFPTDFSKRLKKRQNVESWFKSMDLIKSEHHRMVWINTSMSLIRNSGSASYTGCTSGRFIVGMTKQCLNIISIR